MKVVRRRERPIPESLRWRYERARAALESGVTWEGSIDSITYLTAGEAIAVVGEFLDEFEKWLKTPPAPANPESPESPERENTL